VTAAARLDTPVAPRRSALHRPPTAVDVDGLWRLSQSASPPTILDVRDEKLYRRGHVQKSVCCPESHTTALVRKVQESARVVLVCGDGRLSANVARLMGVCGFPDVAYLKGGIDAWTLADKPILETTRSGNECPANTLGPGQAGDGSAAPRRLTPRVLIAGLLLSTALLTLLAWALAGGGP
jgi:rhodanese-related sulfurtransferase